MFSTVQEMGGLLFAGRHETLLLLLPTCLRFFLLAGLEDTMRWKGIGDGCAEGEMC